MLRKITSFFFIIFLFFSICINVDAGIKTGMTIFAVKKIVPHLIKGYGKRAGGYAETKVIDYIKKNPNSKKEIFSFIDDYVKKNPTYLKNSMSLKNKLNDVSPQLAKISMKTPKNGKWSGDVGNSVFWPNKLPNNSAYKLNDLQKIVGKDGIPFKNGYPDFTKFSTHRVDVPGMVGKQSTDIPKTIKELISKGNFKNEKEVRDFVSKNDLIFHHEPGGKSMSLVKKIVHDSVRHEGGASGLRGGKP